MKTLLYSFGFLTLLISPATCTMDSNGNIQLDEQTAYESQNTNDNLTQKEGDIDPIVIPKKP